MATYRVGPDDYAGWNPTGRNFALISAAVGAIGLLSWLSLNHHLGALRPSAVSDQLLLSGLVWLGVGGSALMAMAAVGSILLSLKSRGTVSVTAEGIFRTIKSRTHSLAWSEIDGFVPMPYGGITLIAASAENNIVIPRFLDDYRACIAEIKNQGIHVLPASTLRQNRKTYWMDRVRSVSFVVLSSLAINSHESPRVRIASLSGAILLLVYVPQPSWSNPDAIKSRWAMFGILFAVALFALLRMALTW